MCTHVNYNMLFFIYFHVHVQYYSRGIQFWDLIVLLKNPPIYHGYRILIKMHFRQVAVIFFGEANNQFVLSASFDAKVGVYFGGGANLG